MRRILQVLVLSGGIGLIAAPAALAASSPTIATGAATSITTTSAVLNGRVNPNGSTTHYIFSYGPTTAYGSATVAHSAGKGTKTIDISRTITGLTPGTIYHYRLTATNGVGAAAGLDRTFTTAGHPPAAVITGAAVDVGKTVATATGVINPEGAPTNWVVQYGLSTTYSVQTIVAPTPLPALDSAVPVALRLTGLAPGTLFHYRIVAVHGTSVLSDGLDQTFFTEPSTRPVPKLTTHTSPGTDKKSPFSFTTSGSLGGATSIPAAQRCAGNVGIRFFNGKRQLAFVVAPVGTNCKFSVGASFRKLRGPSPAKLSVTVDYRGTGYVASVTRTDHVTAG
jgi:phosphodiesterase/alkaline phosphatase D-like protein